MSIESLTAEGIGDVPVWLADEGLQLAVKYFEENDIDPDECFKTKDLESDSNSAYHWKQAMLKANQVLLANPRYEFSMIDLGIEN